ncbi:MAG: hypothetical protein M1838_003716 [Thelocarpon superellum]|nr:MAG: hypothetical protein M1838_003716 [Thelocarpon superellum]
MAFLFGRSRQNRSSDLPRLIKELVPRLKGPGGPQKAEELAKVLSQMKFILQGTHDTDSSPEQSSQLVSALVQEDVLIHLATAIHQLPFESRKDSQVIFSYIFRFTPPNSQATAEPLALNYVINHRPEVIIALCRGYDYRESAMPCGTVLREILKHDAITAMILYDEPQGGPAGADGWDLPAINPDVPQSGLGVFWRFFDWIDKGAFEVSADAFTTFRDLLTKHKQLVSHYLSVNFDRFFSNYNSILVQSSSYVTKRQSIKLLGEILLDRANFQVMTTYVDRGENLKLCMNLLKDDRKMVQYEGFHVFKVFVANPHKSVAVQRILINNRTRLVRFLSGFLEDRLEDEQFIDEKAFLQKQIENLPAAPVEPSLERSTSSASASQGVDDGGRGGGVGGATAAAMS